MNNRSTCLNMLLLATVIVGGWFKNMNAVGDYSCTKQCQFCLNLPDSLIENNYDSARTKACPEQFD